MKSGIKTTEFWATTVVQLIGLLATFGVVTPVQMSAVGEAVMQLGGLAAMVASAFGYSISRGIAKKNKETKDAVPPTE